jgi:hypothetical protein
MLICGFVPALLDNNPIGERQTMAEKEEILCIVPSARTSARPLVDRLTHKMTAAYRQSVIDAGPSGRRICRCGVESDSSKRILPNGMKTNALCVHYLAFHRDEIPAAEREKVRQLTYGHAEPTAKELIAPR